MFVKKKKQCLAEKASEIIYAPMSGRVIPLAEVNDVAFAGGMFGSGAAIMSEADILFAPTDGVISNLSRAGHAVVLSADCGAELLIHIGIDTTVLRGNFFEPLVLAGERVRVGEPLIAFDRAALSAEGYDTTVMLTVINSDKFEEITAVSDFADGARAFLKLIHSTQCDYMD